MLVPSRLLYLVEFELSPETVLIPRSSEPNRWRDEGDRAIRWFTREELLAMDTWLPQLIRGVQEDLDKEKK